MKKLLFTILSVAVVLTALSGCGLFNMPQNPIWEYDFTEMKLVQLEPPHENQPIITVYTTMGEFTAMLFPEYAPNTVNNFIERINDGFYTDKPIFALKESEYLFSGALDEAGSQGVTSDGKLIPNETSVNLWPFKGALLSYSARQGYGDSRFIAVGSVPFDEETEENIRSATRSDGSRLIPEELIQAFMETPNIAGFSGGYTIFGQIIDGFDTLDKLLAVKSDEETLRPLEDIKIDKIELS